MEARRTNSLIESLKRQGLHGRYLAYKLSKKQKTGRMLSEEKEYDLECSLYRKFLMILDEETRKEILSKDYLIDILTAQIEEESHWQRDGSRGFVREDSFLKTVALNGGIVPYYYVKRENDTYVPVTKESDNKAVQLKRELEMEFITHFNDQLNEIAKTFNEREEIMETSLVTAKKKDRRLARQLAEYLGYFRTNTSESNVRNKSL